MKHTGPSVRCRDTTDNFSVDERSRECNVQVGNARTACLGMSCSNRGFFTQGSLTMQGLATTKLALLVSHDGTVCLGMSCSIQGFFTQGRSSMYGDVGERCCFACKETPYYICFVERMRGLISPPNRLSIFLIGFALLCRSTSKHFCCSKHCCE